MATDPGRRRGTGRAVLMIPRQYLVLAAIDLALATVVAVALIALLRM